MGINTVYADLHCPFCKQKIASGVGFRIGALTGTRYRVGETISWEGAQCRPPKRPTCRRIKTIGYFNCDNIKCTSWRDCYPEVQQALVTIEENVIVDVRVHKGKKGGQNFDIIEPKSLS